MQKIPRPRVQKDPCASPIAVSLFLNSRRGELCSASYAAYNASQDNQTTQGGRRRRSGDKLWRWPGR